MGRTVYAAFCETAAECPDHAFLHIPPQATRAYVQGYANTAVEYTYGEALAAVDALRLAYQQAGYGGGQRVALVLDNRAEFFLHFLALNALRISVVPVNSALLAEEMAYVITHSDCALVVTLPAHREAVTAALERPDAGVPALITDSLCELAETPPPAADEAVGIGDEATLLYTSGTTGKPKGCLLSNAYFIGMGEWYLRLGGYCTLDYGRERLLTPLPLVHMNALCCSTMAMIMSAGCIIQLDRFHAGTWWETVRESRATCLHYLGVMPAILLTLPETPADDVGAQIRFGLGAGIDPKHQAAFEARFGFPLIEAWAMTETGAGVCISAHQEPRHVGQRCIGRPLNAIEYRLVDETGEDAPAGTAGELLIRMAGDVPRRGFFSGYYKDKAATQAAWEGGYFHTGDVVYVDANGFFYFVDRRKNIIRRSGENIAATEVENVLLQHPAVANCVVVPVYDRLAWRGGGRLYYPRCPFHWRGGACL